MRDDLLRLSALQQVRCGAEAASPDRCDEVPLSPAGRRASPMASVGGDVPQPAASKEEALRTGARRYIGSACKRCGGVVRYAVKHRCVACIAAQSEGRRRRLIAEGCQDFYEIERACRSRNECRAKGRCAPVYRPGELHVCSGPCAICGAHGNRLDHDHATGAVRGTLCDECNRRRVGRLETFYTPAITYLARHGSDALTRLMAFIVEAQLTIAKEDAAYGL